MSNTANSIIEYQQVFIPVFLKDKQIINIAIRSFSKSDDNSAFRSRYFLVVDPYTLQTSIKKVEELLFRKPTKHHKIEPGYFSWEEIKNTLYIKLLFNYTSSKHYHLENAGLKHAESDSITGSCITVDLCPSNNPFEQEFFKQLITHAQTLPVPVTIAISGLWLVSHFDEFSWLLAQEAKGYLSITWVNHSYSHLYLHNLPYDDNFLLFDFTNIDFEFLETEKLLIENDETPSIFMRFPGLVSNEKLILAARKYGLIPLGSNNWIAKEQKPIANGDIILLHGNGNETEGIKQITPYIENHTNKWLSLYDMF